MMKTFLGIAILVLVGGVWFFLSQGKTEKSPNTTKELSKPTSSAEAPASTLPVNQVSNDQQLAPSYYTFSKTQYDDLRTQNVPVLLYFFANWCPTCAAQTPVLEQFLKTNTVSPAVVLRVNYNDTDTDAEEKTLAQEFGITYQHTFVGVDRTGKEVLRVTGQQTETDLENLFTKL